MNTPVRQILKSERGILTLDFIFASIITFAFAAILFSFAMTLSVVEVVQYVSYSVARNYNLGHLNETEQKARAQQKYNELINNPAIEPFLRNDWFRVEDVIISDFNDEFQPDVSSELFVGARIPFVAPILYKRIPILGTTGSDPNIFKASIQSFLGREPSFSECRQFMNGRANAVSNLGYNMDVNSVVLLMDNGC